MSTLNLFSLEIPAGFYRNGTEYMQRQRWTDGNLIRFMNGAPRTIGGWEQATQAQSEPPVFVELGLSINESLRGMFQWRTLTGDYYTAFGTTTRLLLMGPDGTISDITPAGFTALAENAVRPGYGSGFYGRQSYGSERTSLLPQTQFSEIWMFDAWGEELIATVAGNNRVIYRWAVGLPQAVEIVNAPDHSRDVVVTDQRILLSISANDDLRRVDWSDTEDYDLWTPADDNLAGFLTLSGNGYLVAAINIGRDVLIFGERDVNLLRFIGSPYLFAAERVADNTAIAGPHSVINIRGVVYWMGPRSFYIYAGGEVRVLPCEVEDYVFERLDPGLKDRVTSFSIAEFDEVWWLYPDRDSLGENNAYVAYNYADDVWFTGKWDRVDGVGSSQWFYPIMVDAAGKVYTHELVDRVPGAPGDAFVESGIFEIQNGSNVVYINRVFSDVEPAIDNNDLSDSQLTLVLQNHQNDTPRESGPYDMTRPTPVRAYGRYVQVKYSGATKPWRAGTTKLNGTLGGAR